VKLYNDLDTLLILALVLSNNRNNATAVRQKAIKLMKKVQPIVGRAVLKTITQGTAAQAVKALELFIEDYLYYALPASEIGQSEHPGMVIINHEEAIPLNIHYETEEDFKWARRNESEILTTICKSLLWDAYAEIRTPYEYELKEDGSWSIVVPHEPIPVKADILLFGSWGFSGAPKYWGVELKKNEPLFLTELVAEDRETPTFLYAAAKETA
jgi:hypothetical protein